MSVNFVTSVQECVVSCLHPVSVGATADVTSLRQHQCLSESQTAVFIMNNELHMRGERNLLLICIFSFALICPIPHGEKSEMIQKRLTLLYIIHKRIYLQLQSSWFPTLANTFSVFPQSLKTNAGIWASRIHCRFRPHSTATNHCAIRRKQLSKHRYACEE